MSSSKCFDIGGPLVRNRKSARNCSIFITPVYCCKCASLFKLCRVSLMRRYKTDFQHPAPVRLGDKPQCRRGRPMLFSNIHQVIPVTINKAFENFFFRHTVFDEQFFLHCRRKLDFHGTFCMKISSVYPSVLNFISI